MTTLAAGNRLTIALKTGWRFACGESPGMTEPDFNDSAWQAVRVPHDWAISGPFDREHDIQYTTIVEDGETRQRAHTGRSGGLPHAGKAGYRLRFELPADLGARRVRLEFDGVMSHSRVYCNGREVGAWPYGYSSFAFDVTNAVRPGDNLLAVTVDNPPLASRWYPGAGIYRQVRLVLLAPVHVAHWGVTAVTPEIRADRAGVVIRTEIEGHSRTATGGEAGITAGVTLETRILDPDGACVAEGSEPFYGGTRPISQRLSVPRPRCWSLETPECYRVESRIIADGLLVDRLETVFGIRSLEFDPLAGFKLNGRRVMLQGVCLHHDLGPLGSAVNRAALERQLRLLREMGCNAIRTSHNPPAPELLELTDRMGFLVIDEAFDEWRLPKCENGYHILFDEWAEHDLRAMVRRDRNHPSVILWSLGNEVPEYKSPDGAQTARLLHKICREEDPTRPTTGGINHSLGSLENGVAAVLDVPGWNYKPHEYSRHHAAHPDWPMYGSETASCVSSRGEYYFPVEEERGLTRETLQINSYDWTTPNWANIPDVEFRGLDENPFIMGEFVWTGFDYLGEPTPYGEAWPSRSSYFGIIDLCGIPKDRFYLYQSRWTDKPVLHILPHWTWPGREGQLTPVHVYSRFDVVELFVNGRSQGIRRKHPLNLQNRYRLVWSGVCYEAGELKAVAYDAEGKPVAEAVTCTAGEPARIEAVADRDGIATDGEDMAFVRVRVLDAQGVPCPRADLPVSFAVTGPAEIAAVDNGDPTSLESFQSDTRQTFNGQCMLYLRAVEAAGGAVLIRISAPGLEGAEVTLAGRPAGG